MYMLVYIPLFCSFSEKTIHILLSKDKNQTFL